MKTRRAFSVALALVLSLAAAAFAPQNGGAARAQAQQYGALERGYRTGYSDGYQAGYRDALERAARDYRNKEEYAKADRAYISAYGAVEDYRDGYQQGFETGYGAGFDRQGFDSTVPAGLSRRGASARDDAGGSSSSDRRDVSTSDADRGGSDSDNARGANRQIGSLNLPLDTTMRVELLTNLSTDATQRGDRFEARVIEPAEYEGARIVGRVASVKRPGKVRGSGELQLDFEQISLPDGRFTNFHAQVIEVVNKSAGNVGDVDEEGGVRGKDTTKDDVTKVGAGAGIGAVIGAIAGGGKGAAIGAIIGAIAGGGKGAAIGAVIGAGAGAGSVYVQGKDDLELTSGTELTLRASAPR